MFQKHAVQIHQLPYPYFICNVPVHPLKLTDLSAWILYIIATQQRAAVMYANVHAINLAQTNNGFCQALHSADVVFCDGHGVRLASLLLGKPLPERFTPPDWIQSLASLCAQHQYRLFLLGAKSGIAEQAAQQLRTQFPNLAIATHHGYFDTHGSENEKVLQCINSFAPHIVLVGMGMPLQECWIATNLPWLRTNVAMAVGALFDYLAGNIPRGPQWLTDHGFEWLCRLWFEPYRLWRRYILGNPYFLLLLARYLLQSKRRTKGPA